MTIAGRNGGDNSDRLGNSDGGGNIGGDLLGRAVALADLPGDLLGDALALLNGDVLADLKGNLDGDLPGDLGALLLGDLLALGVENDLDGRHADSPGHLLADGDLDGPGDGDGDLLALAVPHFLALGGISIARGLSLALAIATLKASTDNTGSNNLGRARHHRTNLNTNVGADLLDDVLALGVSAGLDGGLGVLGADLVVLGVALLVGDLPRDGEAVLQVGGLALGVVLGLVLGLGTLLAPLVIGGGAHLGVHSVVGGLAAATIAAGLGLGAGHNQGWEEEDNGQSQHFDFCSTSHLLHKS